MNIADQTPDLSSRLVDMQEPTEWSIRVDGNLQSIVMLPNDSVGDRAVLVQVSYFQLEVSIDLPARGSIGAVLFECVLPTVRAEADNDFVIHSVVMRQDAVTGGNRDLRTEPIVDSLKKFPVSLGCAIGKVSCEGLLKPNTIFQGKAWELLTLLYLFITRVMRLDASDQCASIGRIRSNIGVSEGS